MIKLLSPVDKVEEVEELVRAGADEFYCGLLTPEWHSKYIAGAINRRPGGNANFTSFEELQDCLDVAHSQVTPVYLTLNEHYYTQQQYPYLQDFIARVAEMGINALIVADVAVLLLLRETDLPLRVIISTGGTTFNSETVKFYQDLGASRVILPRHLTIKEIGEIAGKVSGIQLETFIFNSRCPNVDGFCTFQHGLADPSFELLYKNACMLPYEISVAVEEGAKLGQLSARRQHIWETVHVDDYPCGACALWEFNEMRLASVKIVGRGNPTKRKIADLRFLRTLVDNIRDGQPSREEFRRTARKKYQETYGRPCREYMCYYPEVMTG